MLGRQAKIVSPATLRRMLAYGPRLAGWPYYRQPGIRPGHLPPPPKILRAHFANCVENSLFRLRCWLVQSGRQGSFQERAETPAV